MPGMALPFSTAVLAAVNEAAGRTLGRRFRIRSVQPVTGGCINRSFAVGDGEQRFFLKVNDAAAIAVFEAEADGLAALRESEVRAPMPIEHAVAGSEAFLLLEYLPLRAP